MYAVLALFRALSGVGETRPRNILRGHAGPAAGRHAAFARGDLAVHQLDPVSPAAAVGQAAVAKAPAPRHPPCEKFRGCDQPVELIVPGAPEWQVTLECDHDLAFLEHRVTGEVIFVGLMEQNVEVIVYTHRLDCFVKSQSVLGAGWPTFPVASLVRDNCVRHRRVDGRQTAPRGSR